jgi:hypothetical protein
MILGGSVTLKTNNPFDAPIINPNYFTTDLDLVDWSRSPILYLSADKFKNSILSLPP